jgi:hypothetical protein
MSNIIELDQKDEERPSLEHPVESDEGERYQDPEEGWYGWVCTACVFFINGHTWGLNSVWKPF